MRTARPTGSWIQAAIARSRRPGRRRVAALAAAVAALALAPAVLAQGRSPSPAPARPAVARLEVEPASVTVTPGEQSPPIRVTVRGLPPSAAPYSMAVSVDLPVALRPHVTLLPPRMAIQVAAGATEAAAVFRFSAGPGAPPGGHVVPVSAAPAPAALVAAAPAARQALLVIRQPPGTPGMARPGPGPGSTGAPGAPAAPWAQAQTPLLPPPTLWVTDCSGKDVPPDCRLSRPDLRAGFGWTTTLSYTLDWRWQVALQPSAAAAPGDPPGLVAQNPVPKKGPESSPFFKIDFGKMPPLALPTLGEAAKGAQTQAPVKSGALPGAKGGSPSGSAVQALPCPPAPKAKIDIPGTGKSATLDGCPDPDQPGPAGPAGPPPDPPLTLYVRVLLFQGGAPTGPASSWVAVTYMPRAQADLWALWGGQAERPELTLRFKWEEARFRMHKSGPTPAGVSWRYQLGAKPFPDPVTLDPGGLLSQGPVSGTEFALNLLTHLDAPKDLYVRVVPVDGPYGKKLMGTASNQVVVHYAPFAPAALLPETHLVSWQPPVPYDWMYQCWRVATHDVLGPSGQKVVSKDQKWNACKKEDKSDLEQFAEGLAGAIGDFFGLLVDGLNWMAARFDDLKKGVVSAIVAVLKDTKIGCGTVCQGALAGALDAGLVALGVPPDIPNFDALVAQLEQGGVEYLAGELVAAAGAQNVPLAQDAAKAAIEKSLQEAKKAASGGASGAPLWVPDPLGAYRPATLVLALKNPGLPALVTVDRLRLESATGRFEPIEIPFQHAAGKAIAPGTTLQTGQTLTIPLFPKPTKDPAAWLATIKNAGPDCQPLAGTQWWGSCVAARWDKAKADLAAWTKEYTTGSEYFTVKLLKGPTAAATLQIACALSLGGPCVIVNQVKQPAYP